MEKRPWDDCKKPHEIRVSVIVPCYNVEKYIRATLDSLLRQSFVYFEIIVIDDGSSDGTVSIIETYDDVRIVLIRHAANQGLSAARNTGLDHARGEFVALLDADDIALPSRLAEQVTALEQDPTLGMVGSHVEVLRENGQPNGNMWTRPVTPEDAAIRMLFRNTFSAVMTMRKSAIPPDAYRHLPMAEDYDFNMRMARHSKVTNINKPLTQVRIRHTGLTQTKKDLMEVCVQNVMRELIREFDFEPTVRELNLNRHVGALTLPNSPELLDEVEAWLMKLHNANTNIKRYPEAAFIRILASEWFNVCKFASPLGFHALRTWHASALQPYWQPTLRERLKFAMKCLFRHRRDGGDVASLA